MSNFFDYNDADRQFDLIPDNTVAPMIMHIKPGGQGDGGWLRPSQNSDAMMLECEFVVLEGPFARRKIFQFMVVSGGKQNEKGESIAGGITRSNIRAMLESARNVRPDDMSPEATQKRCCPGGWADLEGLCFVAKIGIEKGQNGYNDKNKIKAVITPDMKEYMPIQQRPTAPQAQMQGQAQMPPPQSVPASANPTPSWAR